jgi:hypothetical protein
VRARAMRYLRPSIHSVSACEPRPSAASAAALYPRLAWSLDMMPWVRGFSARSARKPATAAVKAPIWTRRSARCFAQVSCSSRLFMALPNHESRLPSPYLTLHWSWSERPASYRPTTRKTIQMMVTRKPSQIVSMTSCLSRSGVNQFLPRIIGCLFRT